MTRYAETLTGQPLGDLPEFDAPPADPMALFVAWLDAADQSGVREPRAFTLATSDAAGRPSSRTVLLKAVEGRGLVFSSHHGSRKGRELQEQPCAAATIYWRETLQQVNLAGPVERLSEPHSDALFRERPRAAQATTIASRQSASLQHEGELRERAERLAQQEGELARPVDWGGYRLIVDRAEFWHGRPDRLHRRLQYVRAGEHWEVTRLQP